MMSKLNTSISWPISAPPPLPTAESRLVHIGPLMMELSELEVVTDCDCVDADWRAGQNPDASTISTLDVITPKVYQKISLSSILNHLGKESYKK